MDSKLKCVFELPVEGNSNPVPQENNVEANIEEKIKREIKSPPKVTYYNDVVFFYFLFVICFIGRLGVNSVTS